MKVSNIAEALMKEVQTLLGAGKRREAVNYLSTAISDLIESSMEFEDTIIQIDLDCGERKAVWITNPKLVNATIVVAENPTIMDETDGVFIDDDRVVVSVDVPELMTNSYNVRRAIELYDKNGI